MFFYNGLTCPVCNKSFVEGEDIVSCPTCGLPHHRTCWHSEGKCHLDDLHGTEQQWTRESADRAEPTVDQTARETKTCPHCRADVPEFAEFCSRCGRPLQSEEWSESANVQTNYAEYRPFQSPFGAFNHFSPDEIIGRHKAKDLAAVVGNNSIYYLPRFRRLIQTGSGGWNWAAFLFGPYWLLYRKNYFLGIIYFLVQTVYNLASGYVLASVNQANTVEDMMIAIEKLLQDDVAKWMVLLIFLVYAILLMSRILLGILGNRLYFRDCEKRIDRAQDNDDELSAAELSVKGGVSMTAAVIAYLIPGILSYILAVLNLL